MKFLILIIIIVSRMNAFFEYSYYSAKALSLGNSGVSSLLNSDAIFYNPAILANLSKINFSFNYSKPFGEIINDSISIYNISANKPLKRGGLGLGFYNLISDNYSEILSLLGYGYDFRNFNFGINLKYGALFFSNFERYEPILNKKILNFISFDFGFLINLEKPKRRIGFSIINIISTRNGLTDKKSLPLKFNLGISQNIKEFCHLGVDLIYSENYFNYGIGLEFLILKNIIEFNFGINREKISTGISVNIKNFTIDWTSCYNILFEELNLSSIIGIRAKF